MSDVRVRLTDSMHVGCTGTLLGLLWSATGGWRAAVRIDGAKGRQTTLVHVNDVKLNNG